VECIFRAEIVLAKSAKTAKTAKSVSVRMHDFALSKTEGQNPRKLQIPRAGLKPAPTPVAGLPGG